MSTLSRKIITLLLCLVVGYGASAQQKPGLPPLPDHCTSSKAMQELYKKHPASRQAAINQEVQIKKIIAGMRQQRAALAGSVQYTIPVVFHVNDPVNPYKVTMEQVRSAIDILNQDYNLLNADYSSIDPRFIGLAANLHITFRLADIDPQGNPTNGVTYHFNDLDGRSPDGTGSAVKSISYWPGEKYLNIWIVGEVEEKGVYNNSGWTYLPDNWVASNHLDGVVYNWRYLGAPGVGSSENFQPNMKRVLTHEIGHFLNLQHTFENECTAPGDEVDDTPPTKSNFGGCNLNANWCGVVANTENYMDYSSCPKMFTAGQSDRMLAALTGNIAQRNNLWSAANLAATLLPDTAKRLVANFTLFNENDVNTGTITTADTLKLLGGAQFAVSSGNLVAGTHFNIQNVPAGLTAQIQVINNKTAVLTFSGTASQHAAANNADSVKITFLNAAIQGGAGPLLRNYLVFGIHFIDPYKIHYIDMTDATITSSYPWQYIDWGFGDAQFGGWFDNNKLRFETYEKAAVCEGATRNISPLAENTIIGDTSNFVAGGAFPNEHDVYSAAYTKWAGKTAYIGLKFTWNTKTRYGWMRVTVDADGKRFTMKDYAWNDAPNGSIRAGDAGKPTVAWSRTAFRESLPNDGALPDTAEVSLLGNTFAISSGNFVANTHYTVSNVPAGMTVKLAALTNTTARFAFIGKATSHAVANSGITTITFLPAAFSNQQPPDSSQKNLNISFRDPYQIKYVDVDDATYTINFTNNWYKFYLDNNADLPYGLWADSGRLRFETYKKPMVTVGNTRNIAKLAAGTVIGDSSNFVEGGAYPLEHDLTSASYTTWKGQTAYAGFTFSAGGETFYGWFRFKVNASGNTYTLMDYAYNTMPHGSIKAGQTSSAPSQDTGFHVTDYCTASTALNYNTITRVRFANLDNSSQWDGYKDFTALSATVATGQSYQLQVNLGVEYWPDISVAVWIDWNGDKQLNDTTEKVYVKRGSGPFSQTITVPANAKTGETLMRVRMGYGSNVKPCGVDAYQGEVEDYKVKVTGGSSLMMMKEMVDKPVLTATSPFDDRIQLYFQSIWDGPVIIRLYGLDGHIVKEQREQVIKGMNRLQVNSLSSLPSGVYLIDISRGFERISVKVVK
ncbi:hypothetical protein HHL17_26425 [Chitinophaga sp. G-6-1-13]|uniref:T9SS C-terminal target domain-containing protein n=1 Tax=Chitinophaga fulva TaxID=2728842 RepID=A0A848GTF1_9BACT|nr:M43 family zinc metalloprotease [Chitinophaga fulva]NML40761.1 hypothetical protein [Chitinophaga fulva]